MSSGCLLTVHVKGKLPPSSWLARRQSELLLSSNCLEKRPSCHSGELKRLIGTQHKTPFVTSGCRTRSAFSGFLPVYFQVTSSMVRLLSLGRRFFSQAQQWTCWSVGEIMKKLEEKNQNQETMKLDSHRMIQFILCPQTTGAIQQLPR